MGSMDFYTERPELNIADQQSDTYRSQHFTQSSTLGAVINI